MVVLCCCTYVVKGYHRSQRTRDPRCKMAWPLPSNRVVKVGMSSSSSPAVPASRPHTQHPSQHKSTPWPSQTQPLAGGMKNGIWFSTNTERLVFDNISYFSDSRHVLFVLRESWIETMRSCNSKWGTHAFDLVPWKTSSPPEQAAPRHMLKVRSESSMCKSCARPVGIQHNSNDRRAKRKIQPQGVSLWVMRYIAGLEAICLGGTPFKVLVSNRAQYTLPQWLTRQLFVQPLPFKRCCK